MVRTRQRARLEAAQQAKSTQPQEQGIEEQPSDNDKSSEPSSDDSGGEVSDDEHAQSGEQVQSSSRQEQSDSEGIEYLPDVLTLDNSDDMLMRGAPVPSLPERKRVDMSKPSSSLDPGQEMKEDLYFSFDVESLVVDGCGKGRSLVEHGRRDPHRELMKKSVITPDFEKRESAPPINHSRYAIQKMKKTKSSKSAGSGWFDMPAPQLTAELKNDLRLLRMRNALDPARHYKTTHSNTLPRYFQVGRVESGPADFYSSRLPVKQRKSTLVDELLASEDSKHYHKNKYLQLQNKFSSGTKRLKNIKHKKKYKS